MTHAPPAPLLFLDIDGPLIPFGAARGPRLGAAPLLEPPAGANPLAARLDPGLGPLLTALPCELVWATTWMDEANHTVGPMLGLPTLAVVQWPDRPDDRVDAWFGLHWKTRTVVDWAAGRAFVWIDDEIGAGDRDWVSDHHEGRALLYRVDPRIGLRPGDLAAVAAWLCAPDDGR
ncbi:HAD domain-containing protein [Nocardia sp. NPDC127526]|uniref:HAD domain-containing protein n=1 Tax=Nocardia sp. NPDC127526 TaxID=3345393 RepID=UPI00362D9F40